MRPRTALPVAVSACLTLLALPGCGSGGSSSSSSSPTKAASSPSSSESHSELKTNSTPKFASPSSSAPVKSGTVPIAYRNIAIAPDTVKVKVGSTIKWTNYDAVEHNVTSEGGVAKFASKDFGEGGTYEITVNKPGVIHYECTIHPTTMNGTIEVVK